MDFFEDLWILHWFLKLIWEILGHIQNSFYSFLSLLSGFFIIPMLMCLMVSHRSETLFIFLYCLRLDNLSGPIFKFTVSSVRLNLHRATLLNFFSFQSLCISPPEFFSFFFLMISFSLLIFFLGFPFNSLEDPFSSH